MGQDATLIVTAVPNPNEMTSVQEYLKGVLPLLTAAGGKLVKRLKVESVLHGSPCGMVLVMDFDSAEQITSMFESEQYKVLVPVRERGFKEMTILVSREM